MHALQMAQFEMKTLHSEFESVPGTVPARCSAKAPSKYLRKSSTSPFALHSHPRRSPQSRLPLQISEATHQIILIRTTPTHIAPRRPARRWARIERRVHRWCRIIAGSINVSSARRRRCIPSRRAVLARLAIRRTVRVAVLVRRRRRRRGRRSITTRRPAVISSIGRRGRAISTPTAIPAATGRGRAIPTRTAIPARSGRRAAVPAGGARGPGGGVHDGGVCEGVELRGGQPCDAVFLGDAAHFRDDDAAVGRGEVELLDYAVVDGVAAGALEFGELVDFGGAE
mmetsp:Transcript_22070/g.54609  ORF Transcript_22070/g.54609 Transcript_22070/m.54609 type:complete len:284 (+) Transcript_22070:2591-3442(+)